MRATSHFLILVFELALGCAPMLPNDDEILCDPALNAYTPTSAPFEKPFVSIRPPTLYMDGRGGWSCATDEVLYAVWPTGDNFMRVLSLTCNKATHMWEWDIGNGIMATCTAISFEAALLMCTLLQTCTGTGCITSSPILMRRAIDFAPACSAIPDTESRIELGGICYFSTGVAVTTPYDQLNGPIVAPPSSFGNNGPPESTLGITGYQGGLSDTDSDRYAAKHICQLTI